MCIRDSTYSEEEQERLLRTGDHAALAVLFEKYKKRLSRLISWRLDRRLQARIDVGDVLQDVYVTLTNRIDTFGKQPNISSYLWMRLTAIDRVIALHRQHIMARKRDARREISISQKVKLGDSSGELQANLALSGSSIGGKVAKAEIAATIQDSLRSLSGKDREIIMMRIFEGMSNIEVAEALNLSANGASSRFARAMQRLQKQVVREKE